MFRMRRGKSSVLTSGCFRRLLPLLPTFNDIVSGLQSHGAVRSPLMPRTCSTFQRNNLHRDALGNTQEPLKIKQLVEHLTWPLPRRGIRLKHRSSSQVRAEHGSRWHADRSARRMQMKYEINKSTYKGTDIIALLPWHPHPHHQSPKATCPAGATCTHPSQVLHARHPVCNQYSRRDAALF